jgi:hypothetical protein
LFRAGILSFVLLFCLHPSLSLAGIASSRCSQLLKQADSTGSYFFDRDRYLLSTTQFAPAVLARECMDQNEYADVETKYILALSKLNEISLAHEELEASRIPHRSLLRSLLWGETNGLVQEEQARFKIWTDRKNIDTAVSEANALPLSSPVLTAIETTATDAQNHSVNQTLAPVLSAVLPGAGQAYAGAWQAAGLSIVLNGVLLGSTVELAHRGLVLPAILSGTLFSFTYTGGIIGAYQAAKTHNAAAQAPFNEALFQGLFPDLPAYRHFPQ